MTAQEETNYKRVMVVDDAQIDRMIAQKVMTRQRFAEQVVAAESAMDALEYLKSHEEDPESLPSLIFLDINMPEMSGFDFLDAYNDLPETIKRKCIIVMLSSSLHPEDKERALNSPYVFKFLSKPISPDKLKELGSLGE